MIKVQTLLCTRCGSNWERPAQPGGRPKACPDCRSIPRVPAPRRGPNNSSLVLFDPNRWLAKRLAEQRLAIEMAKAALKMGKTQLAIDALEQAT